MRSHINKLRRASHFSAPEPHVRLTSHEALQSTAPSTAWLPTHGVHSRQYTTRPNADDAHPHPDAAATAPHNHERARTSCIQSAHRRTPTRRCCSHRRQAVSRVRPAAWADSEESAIPSPAHLWSILAPTVIAFAREIASAAAGSAINAQAAIRLRAIWFARAVRLFNGAGNIQLAGHARQCASVSRARAGAGGALFPAYNQLKASRFSR